MLNLILFIFVFIFLWWSFFFDTQHRYLHYLILNVEWSVSALWMRFKRTVNASWRMSANEAARKSLDFERVTHCEQTLNARWAHTERTLSEGIDGKYKRFRDCTCLVLGYTLMMYLLVTIYPRIYQENIGDKPDEEGCYAFK